MSQLANLRLVEGPIIENVADGSEIPGSLVYDKLSDHERRQQMVNDIAAIVAENCLADRRPRTERVICQEVARAASEATLDKIFAVLGVPGLVYSTQADQSIILRADPEFKVEKGDT
ncbi:MAG TPA: hypothetical protein VNE40_02475 [Candidatus Dormibacteraeota bacterium]|nr:hypothetical protein [Candidatus Dormibacteraeota bacterium]